jgi:hypothetical protein
MHALVRKLRVDGRRLERLGDQTHGVLETTRGGLALRALASAPGHAILLQMYRPELTGVFGNTLIVRGIEQATNGGAVLAEWQIEVTR